MFETITIVSLLLGVILFIGWLVITGRKKLASHQIIRLSRFEFLEDTIWKKIGRALIIVSIISILLGVGCHRKAIICPGEEHPDYARDLNNLAGLYYSQGLYDKAEPLYKEVIEITGNALGKDHPSYATSLNNLAELYRTQGLYDKAEPLYIKAIEIDKKALGEEHPDYARDLNNLGGLYRAQGLYDQAEPLYKEAMEITGNALGKDHPSYATSLNNLALLYYSQGLYDKAEPLYKEATEITGNAPSTQLTRTEGMKAGLGIPVLTAGVHTQETRSYQLSSLEMLKKIWGHLEKYPSFEKNIHATIEKPQIFMVQGHITVSIWGNSKDKDEKYTYSK